MPDSVPVSPAAQAEPPELWWSPSLGAVTETGRGAVHVLTRSGVLDVTGLEWSELPADAVRLVPAPGPDTEADDGHTPAAGPERITISLDTLWSCILVGVSGLDGAVPPTRRINAAVRLADRAAARDAAAGVRTDGETPQ